MWNKTSVTDLLGIKYPIVQGPFGGRFSSAKLVSTVSNLGGLGSFGLNAYSAEEIISIDAEIKSLTNRPYALNLWVPLKNDPISNYGAKAFEDLKEAFKPYFKELDIPLPEFQLPVLPNYKSQVEAILKVKPPVASFIFGTPSDDVIRELKRAKITIIGTATTTEEALSIEQAGLDLVVVSGAAAGGHRASFLKPAGGSLMETLPLVSQVAPKVKIPVIAAGGIADGKTISSALKAGASAVQIGTAFLATNESNAPDYHKQELLYKPLETMLTKIYTGRLARVLTNKLTRNFGRIPDGILAPYPLQNSFLAPLRKAALENGRLDYLPMWSGQPPVLLKHQSATDLFKFLVEETAALM